MPQTFAIPAIELHIRLPADLHQHLSAVAQHQRTSKNAVLVAAADAFLRTADTGHVSPPEDGR